MGVRVVGVRHLLHELVRITACDVRGVSVAIFPDPTVEPVEPITMVLDCILGVPLHLIRVLPDILHPSNQLFPMVTVIEFLTLVQMLPSVE